MRLRAKEHLESHKKITGDKLAVRVSDLKEKGLANTAIQRDCVVKKMKARIRQANYRLSCIAAQEKLNADRAKAKAEKLAGKKKSSDKPRAKTAKGAPEKKEKKAKKEKKKAQSPAPDEQVKEQKEQSPAPDEQPPVSEEQETEKKEQSPATDEQE